MRSRFVIKPPFISNALLRYSNIATDRNVAGFIEYRNTTNRLIV